MYQLVIPDSEVFNDATNEFYVKPGQTIQVEHSLVSISKWESKWNKPFLSKDDKTIEESVDYIKCMTITQNVKDEVYANITTQNVHDVSKYISAPMTATTFRDDNRGGSSEIVTSEIIYYWLIAYKIPFECQKWHLNRLLTLIKVCSKKNEKPKKMSNAEILSRNRQLNEQRRKQLNSNG